eukprot:COSAG02_NODE_2835_length_7924_cov_8.681534_1_plen_55_part_00
MALTCVGEADLDAQLLFTVLNVLIRFDVDNSTSTISVNDARRLNHVAPEYWEKI